MADTPYMALEIGVPGVTVGPAWAELIEANKVVIAAHTHAPGDGVPIGADGLDINDELSLNNNGLTDVRAASFDLDGVDPGDLRALYVDSDGDLHYINNDGDDVELTNGAQLAALTLDANIYSSVTKAADFSLTDVGVSDKTLILVNSTAATRVCTLPAATAFTAGRHFVVVNIGTNATRGVTFTPTGADKINGINASTTMIAPGGAAFVTNLDGTDDWSVVVPLNGTINDTAIAAGDTLRRKAGTPHEYEFSTFDLSGVSNNIVNRVPSANMFQATTSVEGIVKLARDLGGTSALPVVVALTGDDGTLVLALRDTAATVEWDTATTSPRLQQADTTSGNGQDMTIQSQSTTDAVSGDGGVLTVQGGTAANGNPGTVTLLSGSAGLSTKGFTDGGSTVGFFEVPTRTSVPDGDYVAFVADSPDVPTVLPVGGSVFYSEAGVLSTLNPLRIGGGTPPALEGGTAFTAVGQASDFAPVLKLHDSGGTNCTQLGTQFLIFHPAPSASEHSITVSDPLSAGSGNNFRVQAQDANGNSGNGGTLQLQGGQGGVLAADGGVELKYGSGVVGISLFSPAYATQRIGIFAGTDGSAVWSGGTGGDKILFVGDCDTAPSGGTVSADGFLLWSDAGLPTFRTATGTTAFQGGIDAAGSAASFSGNAYVGGNAYMVVVLDGTNYRIPVYVDS